MMAWQFDESVEQGKKKGKIDATYRNTSVYFFRAYKVDENDPYNKSKDKLLGWRAMYVKKHKTMKSVLMKKFDDVRSAVEIDLRR